MEKLKISIGILSWGRLDILRQTFNSYKERGLLNITDDITIFFQEISEADIAFAKEFAVKYLGSDENIGIHKAYKKLVANAKYDHFLFLENDWYLLEESDILEKRLKSAMTILSENDAQVVRLRHRKNPGWPCGILFRNRKHPERTPISELAFVPSITENPCAIFKEISHKKIEDEDYYFIGAKNTYWTNNPCIFLTKFVKELLDLDLPIPEEMKNKYNKRYKTSQVNVFYLETILATYWHEKTSNVTCLSPGLFTHLEYIEDFKPYRKYPQGLIYFLTWFLPSKKTRRYIRAKYIK